MRSPLNVIIKTMKQQSGLLAGSAIFLFFSIINYLIRFVISVVIARSLGISGKGIYVLLITSAGFLGLFLNLGLSGAFTYLTASGQFKKSELLSFSMLASVAVGISGGLLFLVFIGFHYSTICCQEHRLARWYGLQYLSHLFSRPVLPAAFCLEVSKSWRLTSLNLLETFLILYSS